MTLNVSLRVPDGLVIASDSLSTVTGRIGIAANINTECPKCKEKIKLTDLKMPPVPFPTSTFSFAQKLFPFQGKYGIACWGMASINNKSTFYHVQHLETGQKSIIKKVSTVAQAFRDYFHLQLRKQIKDIKDAPDNFIPLGFQIVGYDEEIGKTEMVDIGKHSEIKERLELGCTITGDGKVVSSLWDLGKKNTQQKANYGSFSLQDAVDYAEFLIQTTAGYQRFANMIPTVGGSVDIALVTPFKKFTWIKRKKLMEVLEVQELGGKNAK